jgi:3-hydroxymyristoyl/3-hydroxydecanoyl-(acyl carrier protein) dehydratase
MQPPLVFSIPHDHPSLAGHFPHRPIVPGVVILDSAMALILRDRPASTVASLDDVKFLARVSPGSEVAVSFRESAPNRIQFVCAVAGRSVLRGRVGLAVGQ